TDYGEPIFLLDSDIIAGLQREDWVQKVEISPLTDAAARLLEATRPDYLHAPNLRITAMGRRYWGIGHLNEELFSFSKVGFGYLKDLTALQGLDLSETDVGDADLVHLKNLTSLRDLDLGDTHVTGAGFHHLSHLKRLRVLSLGSCLPVRAEQLAFARELT